MRSCGFLLLSCLLCVAPLVAACGGGDDDDDDDVAASPDAAALDADVTINGCQMGTATDATSAGIFLITGSSPWAIGHQGCVIISAGADVIWQGDFVLHPLAGGTPPTVDDASPITQAEDDGMGNTVVSFDTVGTYPYFCTTHGATMQGVVFVVP